MRDFVYFDNNATTAPAAEVIDAMTNAMTVAYGNSSSWHFQAMRAADEIENARHLVGALLDCRPSDIVFTSGATESNNLAILGAFRHSKSCGSTRNKVLIGATEHPAVTEAAEQIRGEGATVLRIPVDGTGRHDLGFLEDHLDDTTLLVSVMAANNETGVLSDLSAISQLAKDSGAYVHCDAAQAPGRIGLSISDLELDMVSISGHKMHGPKGVGALIHARLAEHKPIMYGGGHQSGMRPGTLNVEGISGLGAAARLSQHHLASQAHVADLRNKLESVIAARIPESVVVGENTNRLPNTTCIRFPNLDAEALMASMPNVACSAGSACSRGQPHPSTVLIAMGLSDTAAHECVRFSLSVHTQVEDVDTLLDSLFDAVDHVRQVSGGV